jgi:hypothetical protein
MQMCGNHVVDTKPKTSPRLAQTLMWTFIPPRPYHIHVTPGYRRRNICHQHHCRQSVALPPAHHWLRSPDPAAIALRRSRFGIDHSLLLAIGHMPSVVSTGRQDPHLTEYWPLWRLRAALIEPIWDSFPSASLTSRVVIFGLNFDIPQV